MVQQIHCEAARFKTLLAVELRSVIILHPFLAMGLCRGRERWAAWVSGVGAARDGNWRGA